MVVQAFNPSNQKELMGGPLELTGKFPLNCKANSRNLSQIKNKLLSVYL